jgi:predicted ATPase
MYLKEVILLNDQYPTQEHYPFNLPLFRKTKSIAFDTAVTFFAGENGSGKSTLLEAITLRAGIHIWRDEERVRYQRSPYERQLGRYIRLEWPGGIAPGAYFGSDTFRYFTQSLDGWAAADADVLRYFGGQSLVTQSHGQSMMAYFRTRYRVPGLYLLDEPETALSPRSQLGLLKIIREMSRAGHAQFIIATHSPILLACPGTRILGFDGASVEAVDYEDTDYYRLYRDFMADPKRFLAEDDPRAVKDDLPD